MSKNTRDDIRTFGYVLRRTNYGEADRILNLITPEGKISAIARGVRKEKSKLSGAVEMFTKIDINVHFSAGKDLGIVTGAKMVRYFGGGILKDFARMEFAGVVLRKINTASESSDSGDYFRIIDSVFSALNAGVELSVIEAWFWLNLVVAGGEQINLYRDVSGEKLSAELRYVWDFVEMAFMVQEFGEIDADTIKIMRLMISADLPVILRVRGVKEKVLPILKIAQAVAKN